MHKLAPFKSSWAKLSVTGARRQIHKSRLLIHHCWGHFCIGTGAETALKGSYRESALVWCTACLSDILSGRGRFWQTERAAGWGDMVVESLYRSSAIHSPKGVAVEGLREPYGPCLMSDSAAVVGLTMRYFVTRMHIFKWPLDPDADLLKWKSLNCLPRGQDQTCIEHLADGFCSHHQQAKDSAGS